MSTWKLEIRLQRVEVRFSAVEFATLDVLLNISYLPTSPPGVEAKNFHFVLNVFKFLVTYSNLLYEP
jgi:hypothetical protein